MKSMDSHAVRAVLAARAQLVTQKITLTNSIRGLLKTFGIVLGRGKGARFDTIVRQQVAEKPMLATIVEPVPELQLRRRLVLLPNGHEPNSGTFNLPQIAALQPKLPNESLRSP